MAETTKQQTQPSVESVRERGGQSAVGAAEGAAAQVARRATAGATQALHAQGEAVRRGASLGAEDRRGCGPRHRRGGARGG
jgi:hypothetical protein